MTRVIVARHGSTAYNRGGIGKDKVRGWADVPLSPMGRLESRELAQRLIEEPKVLGVVSSDLLRARESARPILQLCKCPGYMTDELRSWNLGDLEGKVVDRKVVKEIVQAVHTDQPRPDGERFSHYVHRYLGFLESVLSTVEGQTRSGMKFLRGLLQMAHEKDASVVLLTHARGIQLTQVYIDHGKSIATVIKRHADELAEEPDTVKPGGFICLEHTGDWKITERWRDLPTKEKAVLPS